MLFSNYLRSVIGAGSLLTAFALSGTAFAAAAPKPVAQKLQPTYNVTLTGSLYFGLRHVDTGYKTMAEQGNVDGYDNTVDGNDISTITDLGTYGANPINIGVTAQIEYDQLRYGSDLVVSLSEYPGTRYNTQLRGRAGKIAKGAGFGGEHNYFPVNATIFKAEAHVMHKDFGRVTFGLAPTMSANASDVTYSSQGSEIGVDYASIAYQQDGVARFVSPMLALPLQGGQGLLNAPVVRVGYRMPTMVAGMKMGIDYLPSNSISQSFGVGARSLGAGMTYDGTFDGGQFKLGVSMANNVAIGSPRLRANIDTAPDSTPNGLNDLASEMADTVYMRSGNAMGLSAALLMQGFDISVAYAQNSPYNDRKTISTDDTIATPAAAMDKYAKASTVTVRAGYTTQLVAGSDTHFGVRYLDSKNVFQSSGKDDGNKSHGSVMDAGVTHMVGGAQLYAGYTKFGDFTANTTFALDDAGVDGSLSTEQKATGFSGIVAGVGYSF